MPRASLLERLLDPVSVDRFVERYFQRVPLKVAGRPGKFDFLFRQSEFKSALDRVTEIRAVFPKQWQTEIPPAAIKQMVNAGATICVTGMESAHPKLLKAAQRIRSELNYVGEVSFRAYLSPPGRGFDLHFDSRVATTLQIAGTKRWWYATEPAFRYPLHNSGHEPAGVRRDYQVPKVESLRSVLLRPGDLLCLPAGVWHCAKAVNTSLALNMAFDHSGAGVFDTIVRALERRLMRDAAWRAPLPVAPGRNRARMPEPLVCLLRERIDALQAELGSMRADEAQLARMWRLALESHGQP